MFYFLEAPGPLGHTCYCTDLGLWHNFGVFTRALNITNSQHVLTCFS